MTDRPSLSLIAFWMILLATSLRNLRLTVAAGAIPHRQSCFWVMGAPASCLRPTSSTNARSFPESIAGKLPRSSVQILLRLEMDIFRAPIFSLSRKRYSLIKLGIARSNSAQCCADNCHNQEHPDRGAGSVLAKKCTAVTRGLANGMCYVWCRQQESNPRPSDYKSAALPTELCRLVQNYSRMPDIFRPASLRQSRLE